MPYTPCSICEDPKTKYEYTRMKRRYLEELTFEEFVTYLAPYLSKDETILKLSTHISSSTSISSVDICRKCLDRFLFPNFSEEDLAKRFNLSAPIIVHEDPKNPDATIYVYRNLTGYRFNPAPDSFAFCCKCNKPTLAEDAIDERDALDAFGLLSNLPSPDSVICHNCASKLIREETKGH
jgi:hypothetical protein